MREHKYRGIRKDNGEEVYGWFYRRYSESSDYQQIGSYISWFDETDRSFMDAEVIPETVEEFTGKQDSKKQDIWKGDNARIKSDDYDYDYVSTVRWDEESGCLVLDYPPGREYDIAPVGWILDIVEKENGTVEVIGHAQPKGK